MAGSPLVRMLGAVIGLASEAIHHSRTKKNTVKERTNSSHATSSARLPASGSTSPLDETSASWSITQEPVEAPSNNYIHTNYTYSPNETAGPSSTPAYTPAYGAEEASAMYDDEAIWELGEMAEYIDLPAYSEVDDCAAGLDVGRTTEGASALQIDGSAESDKTETATEDKVKKEIRMVRELVRLAGPAPAQCRRLPCPVIIPQRRPRSKGRGFVRAYAPVLGECAGINQDVFLKFLKDWYQASKANALIDVVYVAAGIVGFVPSISAQVASIVVQVVAGTARELQSHRRNNSFLDRANQELFMPRGLFAMVMAFKDEVPGGNGGGLVGGLKSMFGKNVVSAQRLDLNQNTVKYSQMTALTNSTATDANSRPKFRISNLRDTSSATHMELELVQAADLVYPDLDRAAEHDLEIFKRGGDGGNSAEQAKARTKWNSAGKFVQDYLDRRAQAEYEIEHRGSSTTVSSDARKPFMSRYADPSHAANSGSLVALLTGGAVVLPTETAAKDESGQSTLYGRDVGRDFSSREPPAPGMKRGLFGREKPKGLIGMGIGLITSGASMAIEKSKQKMSGQTAQLEYQQQQNPAAPYGSSSPAPRASSASSTGRKKIMQNNVLYLMVVNLPTDEDIAAAMAQLKQLS